MKKNHTLCDSVLAAWKDFERELVLCRSKLTAKNVHHLRISSQRLEASLKLASCLKKSKRSKKLISSVQILRKGLSPLRDLQVESMGIKKIFTDAKADKKFSRFLNKESLRASAKADLSLRRLSIRKQKRRLFRWTKKLTKIEDLRGQALVRRQLNKDLRNSIHNFGRVLQDVSANEPEQIHSYRKIAKKIRYKQECVNSFTGKPQAGRIKAQRLASIQSVTGQIQNNNVLLKSLDAFLHKYGRHQNHNVAKVQKSLQIKQHKFMSDEMPTLKSIPWRS